MMVLTILLIKKNKFNMRIFLTLIFIFFNLKSISSANDLIFFIESAYKNNPKLNAERESLKATKEKSKMKNGR